MMTTRASMIKKNIIVISFNINEIQQVGERRTEKEKKKKITSLKMTTRGVKIETEIEIIKTMVETTIKIKVIKNIKNINPETIETTKIVEIVEMIGTILQTHIREIRNM